MNPTSNIKLYWTSHCWFSHSGACVLMFVFCINRCSRSGVGSRITFTNKRSLPSSLAGLRGCKRFQASAVNYSTMLLEADSERLYVGARGAVFALDASDIAAIPALTVSLFVVCCCVLCTSAATSLTLTWLHLHYTMQEPLRKSYSCQLHKLIYQWEKSEDLTTATSHCTEFISSPMCN